MTPRFNLYNNLTIYFCLVCSLGYGQPDYNESSVLSNGELYKIGIEETGIYKLDYNFLNTELGIDLVNTNSNSIKIYGNKGGALPELIKNSYLDGLMEHPTLLRDGGDGKIDPGDYLLFYGEGASIWSYDEKDEIHHKPKNIYDDLNYFFIKISSDQRKAITIENYLDEPTTFVTAKGDLAMRYEEDKTNLLHPYFASQGSGQRWFGDRFKDGAEKQYDEFFDFSAVPLNSSIKLFSSFVARSGESSAYQLVLNNEVFKKSIARTDISNVEASYVNEGIIKAETQRKDTDFNLKLEYPTVNQASDGWLDYIEIHADQSLEYQNSPLRVIEYNSIDHVYSKYSVKHNSPDLIVWDVTFPWDVKELASEQKNDRVLFNSPSDILRTFMVFKEPDINQNPVSIGKVENQNIHELSSADMVVIYHPDFETEVKAYQKYRSSKSNLNVQVISVDKIYNEFSSGRVDPTALRNFIRMLHKRDPQFRYLLLFGDASFDYRHVYTDIPFQNFVPTYETQQSFNPVASFPTDDYFGLLSDNEGDSGLRGALDLSIGRIPVKSPEEAEQVINKIIHYESSPEVFGNWKLRAGFVADDEDGSMHLDQSDGIAESFGFSNNQFNLEKIYFDAFKQESTPGGERYPSVNDEINKLFFQGAFVINYMGHGGPKGWADERVLELTDIESWNNYNKMPLLVTATCTFTGFDDPSNVSPGELSFLNSKGGVIGLFSTVRAVYSNSNRRLAKAVFDHLTDPVEGQEPTLGEVLSMAKNSNAADTLTINSRKFLLIGDPALKLNYPKHRVVTTRVVDFKTGIEIDTLKALQQVTFEGEIQDFAGQLLNDFNGTLNPTLYDKRTRIQTLQQNTNSQFREFEVQKNVLYNGSVSVTNGKFAFTFVLPVDINYTYGKGKMSYYATDLITDASGLYSNLTIGGSSQTKLNDDDGPDITLFINDRTFNNGDFTDENPLLIIDLSDDSGLNVSGNSIGHDLVAILDADTKNSIILNDFYNSEKDNYTAGSVNYPFSNISPGTHSITVKAWDIANNSNQSTIEFEVLERSKDISKTSAYPNPFIESTQFYFEHGLANVELKVSVDIYNVQGQKVVTLEENSFSNGYLAGPIQWDGTNGSGNKLPNGIYFYKITAETERGTNYVLDSEMEKIVLLK